MRYIQGNEDNKLVFYVSLPTSNVGQISACNLYGRLCVAIVKAYMYDSQDAITCNKLGFQNLWPIFKYT